MQVMYTVQVCCAETNCHSNGTRWCIFTHWEAFKLFTATLPNETGLLTGNIWGRYPCYWKKQSHLKAMLIHYWPVTGNHVYMS